MGSNKITMTKFIDARLKIKQCIRLITHVPPHSQFPFKQETGEVIN